MKKADIARKYRDEYGMDLPSNFLAKLMFLENQLMFNTAEDARYALRGIEGKMASKEYKITHPYPERPKNPYQLPPSDEQEWLPFILEYKKPLILSDIHVPYHSISALTAAFDFGKDFKPDCVLLNGDQLDCYQVSKFCKDPNKRNLSSEIDVFADLCKCIEDDFGVPIIFKFGNHEERWVNYLRQNAAAFSVFKEFRLENILKQRGLNLTYVKDKRVIKAGKLNVIHGHEFVTGIIAPVNIARGLFLKAKACSVQGHNHQTSEHTEPTLNNDIITTWSIGCLSELHPEYMPLNRWNHGCMGVTISEDGTFEVINKRIKDGKVL